MKRYNNLFEKIVTLDNLYVAEKKARRGKGNRKEVKDFLESRDELLKKFTY